MEPYLHSPYTHSRRGALNLARLTVKLIQDRKLLVIRECFKMKICVNPQALQTQWISSSDQRKLLLQEINCSVNNTNRQKWVSGCDSLSCDASENLLPLSWGLEMSCIVGLWILNMLIKIFRKLLWSLALSEIQRPMDMKLYETIHFIPNLHGCESTPLIALSEEISPGRH